MNKTIPMIFVCSYLVGHIAPDATAEQVNAAIKKNQEWAEMYCWYVAKKGGNPYAPHLLMTRFLDDTKPEDRELGIALGMATLERCDELWFFLRDGEEPSRGMKKEIERAKELGIIICRVDPAKVEALYAEAYGMGEVIHNDIHICG